MRGFPQAIRYSFCDIAYAFIETVMTSDFYYYNNRVNKSGPLV